MQEAIELFNKYGIEYDREYDITDNAYVPESQFGLKRASEIGTYCVNNNINLDGCCVIIDDYANKIKRYLNISEVHFLETSGRGSKGLTNNDLKKFIEINLPQIINQTDNEFKR